MLVKKVRGRRWGRGGRSGRRGESAREDQCFEKHEIQVLSKVCGRGRPASPQKQRYYQRGSFCFNFATMPYGANRFWVAANMLQPGPFSLFLYMLV